MQMRSGVPFVLMVPSGPTVPVIGMNVPGHQAVPNGDAVISNDPELEEKARAENGQNAGKRAGGGHGVAFASSG